MAVADIIAVKARRYDTRNDETVDLKRFDLIEIRRGMNRITIRVSVEDNRLIVSGDGPLAIYPRAANRFEIPVEFQP